MSSRRRKKWKQADLRMPPLVVRHSVRVPSEATRERVLTQPLYCEEQRKRRWKTKAGAELECVRLRAKSVYRCPACRGWHVTSK